MWSSPHDLGPTGLGESGEGLMRAPPCVLLPGPRGRSEVGCTQGLLERVSIPGGVGAVVRGARSNLLCRVACPHGGRSPSAGHCYTPDAHPSATASRCRPQPCASQ